jgi:hypothetical protein
MTERAVAAEAANKKMLMECANNCALVKKEREKANTAKKMLASERAANTANIGELHRADALLGEYKSIVQELLTGLADAATDLRRHDTAVAGAAAAACDRFIEKHCKRGDAALLEQLRTAELRAVGAHGQMHTEHEEARDAWDIFVATNRLPFPGRSLADNLRPLVGQLGLVEDRLRNYHSDDPEKFEDTQEEIGGNANEQSMESLRKWVKKSREEAELKEAIFDTGFRCVSEGGEVFYFDPEEVSDYMDASDALRAENARLDKLVKEQLAGWGKSDNEVERLTAMLDRAATALGLTNCTSGDVIEAQAKQLKSEVERLRSESPCAEEPLALCKHVTSERIKREDLKVPVRVLIASLGLEGHNPDPDMISCCATCAAIDGVLKEIDK